MYGRVSAKTYFDIKQFLGEGLTSRVYKAFRCDGQGYTQQPVAVKIVKSKKHIQILRNEFEKLQKVQSPNCVKLFSWEQLPQGPALILELLDGLSLHELNRMTTIPAELVDEIIAQAQMGLRDIHRNGFNHGDLNLKNIFITKEGVVKLLDFGVMNGGGEQLGTPQFMSPEIWKVENYTGQSDLFSLGMIREYLIEVDPQFNPQKNNWKSYLGSYFGRNSLLCENSKNRHFLSIKSKKALRLQLSQLVKNYFALLQSAQQTQVVKPQSVEKKKSYHFLSVALLVFSFVTLWPDFPKAKTTTQIEIRSHSWVEVSINGMPYEFSPIKKQGLRKGLYDIRWKHKGINHRKPLNLQNQQTFILKPE
ncbi:MAG: protein kinase [Bdellovibrionales bacterium]|nr:protein kinase [Bdellovibrionales bacterium]NQZ20140.1 protein kinase [Bdellovibrionales bacterium]